MPPDALKECGIGSNEKDPFKPINQPDYQEIQNSELYNAMIYPYSRMVLKGMLWYQGESNAYRNRDKYICLFSTMIRYWRNLWHTRTGGITDINFPFGFVQLSTDERTGTIIGGFPWIRWYQTFGVGYVPNEVVPNVFMATAMDLRDDDGNIHPRTKADIGYRLARAGLAVAYKQNVEYLGPIVSSVVLSSDKTTIDITYGNVTSIEFRNSAGFEVCCGEKLSCLDDNQWAAAPATPKSSLTITLAVPITCASKEVHGVRYLWRETPCPFQQAAVYSGTDANLPSPPYITVF
jgi:sialate O-acetylesterase